MTTGSSSQSNHRALPPRDDRETLSALFDGELPGDAARFALKRLDHDAGWRESCGRWQLIGDALRGEATAAAPPHFAAGVMRALAEERQAGQVAPSSASAVSTTPVRAVSSRRWLGGALAASVAVAAVLVVRPFQNDATSGSVAAGPVATDTVAASTPGASMPGAATPAVPASSIQAAPSTQRPSAAAVAAIDTAPASRAARSAAHGPARASRNALESRPARNEAVAVATTEARSAHQPFHPPADEIVTRPWPRSVLSDGTAAGAFTVGFGAESTASPSLYPFEPRLPQSPPPSRTEPVEPQR